MRTINWTTRLILVVLPVLNSPASAQDQPVTVDPRESPANETGHDRLSPGGPDLEDIDLFDLEIPIVVTAARREQKITTVPYAISVITAEDIRRSGARSIPDALRLAPGVDVADMTSGSHALSPRGFHGAVIGKVLVLVDGRQIFDSVFGGTLWESWSFQLEDIERIEVIRGPGGVTWGPNAVNGVINIITKDPKDQLGLTVAGGGGSRGAHKQHLGYAFADENLRLRVSGEYEANDGFRKGGSLLRKLEDDYKAGRMGLHAIYQVSPDDALTLSAGSALVDGGYPPTPTAAFDQRRNPGSQGNFLFGKWTHQVSSTNNFELTGYVNDFRMCPGIAAIDYRYQQFALQLNQTIHPDDAHVLTWGIDSRVDLADAGNADPFMLSKGFVSTAILGLYVQDQWRFAPRWTLDLGGRIDYEFYGGFQPSARAALSYKVADRTFLYGAVSRAFQMAPAADRFLDIPMLGGLVHSTVERDTKVQPLIAYEIGARSRLLDCLEASINLFWNDHDNLGAFRPRLGPPGLFQLSLDAPAEAAIYGAELEARYAINPQLTLLGNYTYQQLNWRSSVPMNAGDYITPPDHKFMMGARYSPAADLHLSSHLYFVDAVTAPNPALPFLGRHVDSYFRLDLRAEHEFWNDRASIAVGVSNLLDPEHYEGGTTFLNDAEVPRMVYAEFRLVLK